MTITINIGSDLEPRLVEEAAKQGMDPGQYVAEAVRAQLVRSNASVHRLDAEQSRLLDEINRGLSQAEWDRYYSLVAKRQTGALTVEELTELTAASNRIEQLNASRMEQLAELARLRNTTLARLLDELGIAPPPVI